MNPNNLGCTLNGHKVYIKDQKPGVVYKMPEYAVCEGCHRRIIWQDGKLILIRPNKR